MSVRREARILATPDPLAGDRRRGWIEAGGFVVALTALNIAYGLAHQLGADPVAFLVYAMLTAALTLLAIAGPGPDWRAIVRHPLSWVIGLGIIGVEASYYMLLRFVTPAEGSILFRLNLPASVIAGWLIFSRRSSLTSVSGLIVVCMAIGLFATTMPSHAVGIGLLLAGLCAVISVTRNFSAEFHPWNRAARNVQEKIRITGLVLLVTSVAGSLLVATLSWLVQAKVLALIPGVPAPMAFLHVPTIVLGSFMGVFVLTAMQYFSFSAVLRLGTERFIAAGSMVPVTTLAVQQLAALLGILAVAPVSGRFIAILLAVVFGVYVYIAGGRQKI